MFTNGLGSKLLEMPAREFRRAIAGTEKPNVVGAGVVLARKGGTYEGTVDPATVAKRRARNKAARKARRIGRNR